MISDELGSVTSEVFAKELGIKKSKLVRTCVGGRKCPLPFLPPWVLHPGMVPLNLCKDETLETEQLNVGRSGVWLAGLQSANGGRKVLICGSVKDNSHSNSPGLH